ncbi:ABC transporter ATP-binding protein [Lactiplantibacillus sp. WILCCON 0030]|uniref:ABC transporter ATP-binding protein n=1 Tax=Lactiplantibacillus brownii TaxID=3069269 RepID=A0ABU1A6Q1_9LACO|nr:ABC transporter ATP-binding protein [Lactiplantibacillus brownii]MDQ7936127.1 ABC transporter ATP-binding protein [Lactiplantibacillus brownii]
MISIKNLNKYYKQGNNSVHILKDISFDVTAGEFVSIMGPSGSGKSTLINIIGFLDDSFKGSYSFKDQETSVLNKASRSNLRNRSVGFIFQNFKLINNLTVAENIALPLLYRGAPHLEIEQRTNEILEKVNLLKFKEEYPLMLSGGQQQRVSIARALINNPKFLIADEPTGALDSITSQDILNIFIRLNRIGTTIIMVTHDKKVAEKSQRILHIVDGSINSDRRLL